VWGAAALAGLLALIFALSAGLALALYGPADALWRARADWDRMLAAHTLERGADPIATLMRLEGLPPQALQARFRRAL